ncbi:MAG: hypothetical protein EBZ48_08415 [Proteobacteria bacterium]|nr:hypothetical protein [Pseudomonadota bacterium]
MEIDYLVVGSGLTGAVIARSLHDAGFKVLVVDRRAHQGGNVHDHTHPSGIRIHTYGPHYFRTSSEKIWEYVNRFATFDPYEASLKSLIDGRYENWPIAQSYITAHVGAHWKPLFHGVPRNFEEASLAMMPKLVYEKFVKGYSEKQWGVAMTSLDAALAGRFDVRLDDEPRLKLHKYQGIPTHGYAAFMQQMLRGVPVLLNVDYLEHRTAFNPRRLTVFTGPIDRLFEYRLGCLQYRGQRRETEYLPDVDLVQPCGQVNNPSHDTGAHIRTLEWKHMMPQAQASRIRGTVLTREVTVSPTDPDQYEYPFPDFQNRTLYQQYRELADATPKLLVCGRLGEYRYFDMDQAIGRAMTLVKRISAMSELERGIEILNLTSRVLDEGASAVDTSVPAPTSAVVVRE